MYFRMAESGKRPPMVIFDKYVPTMPQMTFTGPDLEWDQWLVKGVGTAARAEDIDARCQAILRDCTLTLVGGQHLYCRRLKSVDYAELVAGDRVDHVGSIYQVATESE